MAERIRQWLQPAYFLGQNPVTLTGTVITTSAALTTLAFWFYDVFLPGPPHPYIGLLVYLILPGIFVFGLLLIPLGIWIRRRKLRATGTLPEIYPAIDLRLPVVRRTLEWVGFATVLNLLIVGTASYRGVQYMDSTNFCGTTCHTVMAPEYTAYQNSPHAHVDCVECHIGPGAPWFVRSKLSGLRQVVAVTFHTYSRPIPSPVKYLRPARDTCERCHWPQRFAGDKFIVNTSYKDDEKNTPQTDVFLLKIGGRTWQGSVGIHGRHLADSARIRYISTDAERQTIPAVYYTDENGKTTEFISTDAKPMQEQLDKGEHRTMDCVDCHNRPTHAFDLPENAVDKAMSIGRISPELPFIRKKAVEVLKVDYPARDLARQRIVEELDSFYRTNYPQIYQTRRALVQQAADETAAIYLRNVFPEMRLTWGAHPNNLGHNDSPGCFRCHDGSHTSADGQTITNDCSACHEFLATAEEHPKVLTDLGVK
jgi:NapC/NirT cytochrome c family, N-terminal region